MQGAAPATCSVRSRPLGACHHGCPRLLRLEQHGGAIHAVAQPRRLRAILKHLRAGRWVAVCGGGGGRGARRVDGGSVNL
jgi:hypothetical protein